jgi:hypothetical protein
MKMKVLLHSICLYLYLFLLVLSDYPLSVSSVGNTELLFVMLIMVKK